VLRWDRVKRAMATGAVGAWIFASQLAFAASPPATPIVRPTAIGSVARGAPNAARFRAPPSLKAPGQAPFTAPTRDTAGSIPFAATPARTVLAAENYLSRHIEHVSGSPTYHASMSPSEVRAERNFEHEVKMASPRLVSNYIQQNTKTTPGGWQQITIAPDEAKKGFTNFNAHPAANSMAVESSSEAIARMAYTKVLPQVAAQGKALGRVPLVLFMAGGNAAGKTTALANAQKTGAVPGAAEAAVIVDTNLAEPRAAKEMVAMALNQGMNVQVVGVASTVGEAYGRMMRRGAETGRVVNVDFFLANHLGWADTMQSLKKDFGANPRFAAVAIDNSNLQRSGQPIGLEDAQRRAQTVKVGAFRQAFLQGAERYARQGKMPLEMSKTIHGSYPSASPGIAPTVH
jgi:hypothetical protein